MWTGVSPFLSGAALTDLEQLSGKRLTVSMSPLALKAFSDCLGNSLSHALTRQLGEFGRQLMRLRALDVEIHGCMVEFFSCLLPYEPPEAATAMGYGALVQRIDAPVGNHRAKMIMLLSQRSLG